MDASRPRRADGEESGVAAAPSRAEAAAMWENLLLAGELSEDCESLAAGLEGRLRGQDPSPEGGGCDPAG